MISIQAQVVLIELLIARVSDILDDPQAFIDIPRPPGSSPQLQEISEATIALCGQDVWQFIESYELGTPFERERLKGLFGLSAPDQGQTDKA